MEHGETNFLRPSNSYRGTTQLRPPYAPLYPNPIQHDGTLEDATELLRRGTIRLLAQTREVNKETRYMIELPSQHSVLQQNVQIPIEEWK